MKEDQKDPNRVVEELRTLANATGATLGTGSKLSVREEDGTALFTGRLNRPGRVEGKESLEEKRGFPKRRPQRQFEEGGCGRCGFEQHNNADDCPARGVICRRCGKKGHYARQCKTKSETKHQPGNGPQVESIRFVEINDEEEGWMVCKGKEKERVLYADTCCSASLVPRSLVEGCIVKERPKSSRYTLAQFDKGLVVETEAIVMIGVEDDKGEYQKIGLKVNIGPENIHGLIKPRRAYLGYDNEVSWITVLDSDKRERKIKVVHAGAEKARRNLPFFKFIPVPQIPVETCNGHVAWNVRENVSIQEWHERWFHPGTARMIGSLKEAHIPFNPAEVRALAESCTKCKQKNATFHKIPRSYGRRVGERKSTFNYRVSWDLGHISERGYKGEHYFSLLIDDSSLWWEAMPLKEKGEAPDHLLEWISKNEAMNRLRSDNAGELKGSRVTIMCKDNNIYMEGIPPYCSQVNGVVERAIREVRSLLRIVLDMLNLPPSMWSALVRGIVELHNKMYSPVIGMSPWKKRFDAAPSVDVMLGSKVIIKPPRTKTLPKTLDLPGKELYYICQLSPQEVVLYSRGEDGITIVKVHPSAITASSHVQEKTQNGQEGSDSSEEESDQGRKQKGRSEKQKKSTEDKNSEDPTSIQAEEGGCLENRRGENRREGSPIVPRIYNQNIFNDKWKEQQSPRIDTGRSKSSTGSGDNKSMNRGELVLAKVPRMKETQFKVAKLLNDKGKRTTLVAWQEVGPDNTLNAGSVETIPSSLIERRVDINEEGAISQEIKEMMKGGGSEEANLVTCLKRRNGEAGRGVRTEEKYELAKIKELVNMIKNKVFGRIVSQNPKTMTMGWRLTEKFDVNEGVLESVPKARWYCHGFRDTTPASTFAGTPPFFLGLLCLVFSCSKGWELAYIDVKSAFLQAEVGGDRKPTVKLSGVPNLPKLCPLKGIEEEEWAEILKEGLKLKEGQTRELGKSLYGDKCSSREWDFKLAGELEEMGYEEIEESIQVKEGANQENEGIIINHVDDLLVSGQDVKQTLREIRSRLECNEPKILSVGEKIKFAGVEQERVGEKIHVNVNNYLNEVMRVSDDFRLRKVTTARHMKALDAVLEGLRRTDSTLIFHAVKGDPVLYGYCDAAYDRDNYSCRLGYKIILDSAEREPLSQENIIAWSSKKVKKRIASSTSAELEALNLLIKHMFLYMRVVADLWQKMPKVILFSDSQPLLSQIERGKVREEPRLQPQLDFVLQNISELNASVKWIARSHQLADAMTKLVWWC
eukprot:GHVU01003651.1.p1 GENE.GHVU01003651.1~~GHVU01003651.1.p1  ORF type:complete len:1455 (+),score=198.40 GHVU01003651.1:569-4366(+)